MWKRVYIIIIVTVFGVMVFGEDTSFDECVRQNKAGGACNKINAIDLAILIDDSHYQEPDRKNVTEFREIYTSYYQRFLKSIAGEDGLFKYGSDKVERAVVVTASFDAIVRQNYDKVDVDPNAALSGYFYDLTRPQIPSILPKVLLKLNDIEPWGRSDYQKIVLVVTRGTENEQFGQGIRELVQKMVKKGNYLFFFAYMYTTAVKKSLSEVFPSQKPDTAGEWNGTHITFINVINDDVNEMAGAFASCVCERVGDCQYVMNIKVDCHYFMDGDEEKCGRLEGAEISYQGSNQTKRSCPEDEMVLCDGAQGEQKCRDDCDMKGWTDWGQCLCTGIQVRNREDETAGHSEFTDQCRKEDVRFCKPEFTCTQPPTTTKKQPKRSTIRWRTSRRPVGPGSNEEEDTQLNIWMIVGATFGAFMFIVLIVVVIMVITGGKSRKGGVQRIVIRERTSKKQKPRQDSKKQKPVQRTSTKQSEYITASQFSTKARPPSRKRSKSYHDSTTVAPGSSTYSQVPKRPRSRKK